MKKLLTIRKAPLSRSMGPHVRQVVPSAAGYVDPFVFLDHFGPFESHPGEKGVPPHPHAGIATITYLLSGSNRHQDSRGHDARIFAGDLAWMHAGRGIVHAEGMGSADDLPQTIHGLQLWISLPAADKFSEPAFFHYPAADLPEFQHDGATIRVLAGDLNGHISPVVTRSPAYLYDVRTEAATTVKLPIPEGWTSGLYVIEGEVVIPSFPEPMVAERSRSIEGNEIAADVSRASTPALATAIQIAMFSQEGNSVTFQTNGPARVLLMGGQPLNDPIVPYGSFVMNSMEQIEQVIQAYHKGEMGVI